MHLRTSKDIRSKKESFLQKQNAHWARSCYMSKFFRKIAYAHCSYLDIYISRKIRLCVVMNHCCGSWCSWFGRQSSNQPTGQTHEPFGLEIQIYRKVASSRLSWLVAHLRIFRLLMKGKFDAYVLLPLAKKFKIE